MKILNQIILIKKINKMKFKLPSILFQTQKQRIQNFGNFAQQQFHKNKNQIVKEFHGQKSSQFYVNLTCFLSKILIKFLLTRIVPRCTHNKILSLLLTSLLKKK